MPTSSQVLILKQKLNGLPVTGRSSNCLFKEEARCAVATVYNLSGCVPLSVSSVPDHDAIQVLGRESAQLFKYHSLPQGYQSILSLDKISGSLQWQALGGTEGTQKISPSPSESALQRNAKGTEGNLRPKSAIPRTKPKNVVDPQVLEYLLKLGFSRSTLEKRDDCVFDSVSPRKAFADKPLKIKTGTKSAPSFKPDIHEEDISEEDGRTDSKDNVTESSSCSIVLEDEYHRIKPSMHMRSDEPEPRPRAAIFSFRDNEFSSHAEVKYLIETQIKVKAKSIQFDPVNVRTTKPGVKSRWIVDFFSDWDLHQAIKTGLTVGKDKLIFYRHDDITKREVSSYKYFMSIQEAKKKLKNKTKSFQNVRGTKSKKLSI